MNNRSNNNRRRGRSNNNRQQGGGGGQQLNRIDSRARGNAPQLLEKYRKLAHDAHLNGDRVQAEYYLQFADHYFRVLADQRVRLDEQRGRREDRFEGGSEESEDNPEFSQDGDFPSYDQPSYQRAPRQAQDDRQREERPRNFRPAPDERESFNREDRFERGNAEGEAEDRIEDGAASSADEPTADGNAFETSDNPFVRENRGSRGLRPRRVPRQAQDDRDGRPPRESRDEAPVSAGLDPSLLPPAIASSRDEPAEEAAETKPRRGRPRKVRPAEDGAGEALESVN